MESFYQEWLKKNDEENKLALAKLNKQQNISQQNLYINPVPSTSRALPSASAISTVTNTNTSNDIIHAIEDNTEDFQLAANSPVDIVYEYNGLQLLVERGFFQRQKKFSLSDHLFYVKIRQIDNKLQPPLLKDIFIFLEKGFQHVLNNVRRFYNQEEHNIAFLTLHQAPMITALNTGKSLYFKITKNI